MKDWAENEVSIATKDCDEYTKNCVCEKIDLLQIYRLTFLIFLLC